jgi:purine-binding chemotaxis protein CheW
MKIVIFSLAGREYGVDIRDVKEVIRQRKVTPVPEAAHFVEGVIMLRGEVVTLINLSKKLGVAQAENQAASRIIITQQESHLLGMLVDGVSGVTSVEEGLISAPDEALKEASYLKGLIKLDKRVVLLMDLEKLFSPEEKTGIGAVESRVEIKHGRE